VIWDEFDDFNASHKIMFRGSADGSAFGPTHQLSTKPVVHHCFGNLTASATVLFSYWSDCNQTGTVGTLFNRSLNSGTIFEGDQTLSPFAGNTKIVVDGSNVYVAYQNDQGQLSFKRSTDNGATFNNPQQIVAPKNAGFINIIVRGNRIYLFWQFGIFSPPPLDLFFTYSTDGGLSFANTIDLTETPSSSSLSGDYAVMGNDVYGVWVESTNTVQDPDGSIHSDTDIYFRKSSDNGNTFGAVKALSSSKLNVNPKIVVNADKIYVAWREVNPKAGISKTFVCTSIDAGTTFSAPIEVSNQGGSPSMSIATNSIYAVWRSGNDITFARSATSGRPDLLTDQDSEHALALDSVALRRDPLPVTTAQNFSQDQTTRIILFATNVDLLPGEGIASISAQAEDAQHTIYPLTVEYIGTVQNFNWLRQLNVRLNRDLPNAGSIVITVKVHGETSNKVLVNLSAQ
jgi:hypothetical protein